MENNVKWKWNVVEDGEEDGRSKSRSKPAETLEFVPFAVQLGCGSHVNSHAHTRYRISIIFFLYITEA